MNPATIGAITLLDTLNSRYPSQTEIRRKGLALRAKAMEGIAIDSISAGDKALAESTIRVRELEPGFRKVESSVGLEGYHVPKDAPTEVMTATGIQPPCERGRPFYLVANIQGRSIGLASLEFADGRSLFQPPRYRRPEWWQWKVPRVQASAQDLEGVGAWLCFASRLWQVRVLVAASRQDRYKDKSQAYGNRYLPAMLTAQPLQAHRLALGTSRKVRAYA